MAWTGDPVWLADVLRAEGLRVVEHPGWRQRGHGEFKDVWGVVAHHTGAPNTPASFIADGSAALRGPLSQLHLGKDGTYTVVAAGVAWHAGAGSWPGLPKDNANWHTIGIEAQNNGTEGWSPAQYDAYVRGTAAILRRLGYGSDRVIGHKEWAGAAQGKWDPGGIDMGAFRRDVQAAIDKSTPPTPPPTGGDGGLAVIGVLGGAPQTFPLPVTGGISHFAGPGDESTIHGRMALSGEPGGEPDDHWYCAMRWTYCQWQAYQQGGETWLRPVAGSSDLAVKDSLEGRRLLVTHHKSGKKVVLRAADTGPRPAKRVIDVSPFVLHEYFGGGTDDQVTVATAPPGAELGPYTDTTPEVPVTDAAKDNQIQLRGPDLKGWPQLGGRSLVDAVAAIGENLGITGFEAPKAES